jgi:alpha-glucosidase
MKSFVDAAGMKAIAAMLFAAGLVTANAQDVVLNKIDSVRPLASGLEIQSGPGTVRILALRDDVVRVTMSATHQLPEDASWAVLPSARTARVSVTPEQDASSVGFDTKDLQVRVSRSTLGITIRDSHGNVIVSDAQPVEFRKDDSDGDLGFRVWKTMPQNEHYFGLGDKTGPLDRRGGAYVMWNTDAYRFQEGTDPLYKSIPFFIADRAGSSYGLFLDNTWRSEFDFGKALRDEYSFGSEGGPLDYYVMYGPQPKQVVEDYAWLTGTTSLPPLWSLGFQQSRYSYGTEQQLRGIADRLRADKIPADAVYMDIDYQIKNRPFTVDPTKFPNFPNFVKELQQKHFHLVMITDLHIADAPNQGYAPYDSGVAGDHFVKNPDGSTYVGTVWPGPSVFPDFTQKQTRQWWGTLYKTFYDEGASGFWNDMNEPSVFGTPTKTMPLEVRDRIDEPGFAPRVTTQREIHNIFGMQNARATYDGMLALKPNQRPFVLTRATYAGGQRYGATWTGDNSSSWAHLRLSTPMLENLGLSGYYMAGDDIGGYAGSPQMDLLTKWIEVGAFNPIYRDHTEKFSAPQEPWAGGPAMEAVRRNYIDERYRLLPYVYTTAEKASRTGIPIMRPLFLEFPDATADKHPLDLDAGNQFMFGPDLMVAPAPYPDEVQDYTVTLPPVPWYDFWTGKLVTRPEVQQSAAEQSAVGVSTGAAIGVGALQTVKVSPQINLLPVYARGGSILPLQPLVQDTEEKPNGPLELRVYPGPDCKGSLYQDDGTSFDYKQGAYLRVHYTCEAGPGQLQLHIGAQSGSYPAWWKQVQVSVYNWPSAKVHATLNGQPLSGSSYNAATRTLRVTIPQSTAASELSLTAAQ